MSLLSHVSKLGGKEGWGRSHGPVYGVIGRGVEIKTHVVGSRFGLVLAVLCYRSEGMKAYVKL